MSNSKADLLRQRQARWSRQKEAHQMMSVSPPEIPTAPPNQRNSTNVQSTSSSRRRSYETENASNALNLLTEKIARRIRDELESDPDILKNRELNQLAAKKGAEQREKVASSYQCGICFELLLGERQPKIIVPCGHTFCAVCLDHHIKVNSGRKCVCPYCRGKIESTAINHHLRTLVAEYAENKNVGGSSDGSNGSNGSNGNGGNGRNDSGSSGGNTNTNENGAGGGGMAGARYLREYNMLKTRRRILKQEQTETRNEMKMLLQQLTTNANEEERIRLEEKQAAADVEAAKKRLQRIRLRLKEQQTMTICIKEKKDLAEIKIEMIRNTLTTITKDADKACVLAQQGR